MAYTRTRNFRVDFRRPYYEDSSTAVSSQIFNQADIKSGSRVEKWKEKISQGNPAGSNYSRTAWRYESSESQAEASGYLTAASSVKKKVGLSGTINPLQVPSSLGPSNPENEALSKLYDKLREKQAGMNGLLILGELRETIKMIRRPGEGLLNLFNDYLGTAKGVRQQWSSRKGGQNRRNVQKALSDLWLEYSFGWKPLISDVRDLATTVARIATNNALRTDRATSVANTSKATTDAPFYGQDIHTSSIAPVFLNMRQSRSDLGVRYVAGVRANLYGPTDTFTGVARETGFTLDNFVPTVWNLLPYSFLVDYFVNVGACIDAIFTDTSAVSWFSKTVRSVDSIYLSTILDKAKTVSTWSAAGWTCQNVSGNGSHVFAVRTILDRTTGVSLPLPGLTLSFPGVDSSKYWNLLALFSGKAAGAYRP